MATLCPNHREACGAEALRFRRGTRRSCWNPGIFHQYCSRKQLCKSLAHVPAHGAFSAAGCFRPRLVRGEQRVAYMLVRSRGLDDGRQWPDAHRADLGNHHDSDITPPVSEKVVNCDRSLFRVAASVGAMTALCKVLGMVREMLLAAYFGVGPVVDAFNYALVVPGFFMSVIGGVNGPCHTALAASLGNRSKVEGRKLTEEISTLIGIVLLPVSIAIFVFAPSFIDLAAPGLAHTSPLTRAIAVRQLRIMSPCAMLAGLIGVAFGSLSNSGLYTIPSLSPAFSSISIISITMLQCKFGGTQMYMGTWLAIGMACGALIQWIVQTLVMAQQAKTYPFRARWLNRADSGWKEVLLVMLPACISSGMSQLVIYVDLFYASFMPGAAAALAYASVLGMAPLGILSSSLLVPLLPRFSRLAAPDHWPQLAVEIRQATSVAVGLGIALAALLIPVSTPTVCVVLQRQAFDPHASNMVSQLMQCYLVGAPIYLLRDVLLRAFFALGDGSSPTWISLVSLLGNVALDWFFVNRIGLGAPGLIIATVVVNILSVVLLVAMLEKRIECLHMSRMFSTWMRLVAGGVAAAATTHTVYVSFGSQILARARSFAAVASPVEFVNIVYWLMDVGMVCMAAGCGLCVFVLVLLVLRIKLVEEPI